MNISIFNHTALKKFPHQTVQNENETQKLIKNTPSHVLYMNMVTVMRDFKDMLCYIEVNFGFSGSPLTNLKRQITRIMLMFVVIQYWVPTTFTDYVTRK